MFLTVMAFLHHQRHPPVVALRHLPVDLVHGIPVRTVGPAVVAPADTLVRLTGRKRSAAETVVTRVARPDIVGPSAALEALATVIGRKSLRGRRTDEIDTATGNGYEKETVATGSVTVNETGMVETAAETESGIETASRAIEGTGTGTGIAETTRTGTVNLARRENLQPAAHPHLLPLLLWLMIVDYPADPTFQEGERTNH